MMIESLRGAKDHLSEFAERAHGTHERIFIARNVTSVTVLISSDDMESTEETMAILSDPDALRAIAEAEREIAEGDMVRGVDAVRALRPK